MTRDNIIRMARDAGIDDHESDWIFWNAIERFAALVAAAEREACAKVCEQTEIEGSMSYGEICADAIRARSNT